MNNPVQKLIDIVGSQAKLARICRVKQQSVFKWLKKGSVPANRVPDAVKASNGEMTPGELCPTAYEIIKASRQLKSHYNKQTLRKP
jgi:DNA-binding transcriptional regulator YdaS (Cro superfamily)